MTEQELEAAVDVFYHLLIRGVHSDGQPTAEVLWTFHPIGPYHLQLCVLELPERIAFDMRLNYDCWAEVALLERPWTKDRIRCAIRRAYELMRQELLRHAAWLMEEGGYEYDG